MSKTLIKPVEKGRETEARNAESHTLRDPTAKRRKKKEERRSSFKILSLIGAILTLLHYCPFARLRYCLSRTLPFCTSTLMPFCTVVFCISLNFCTCALLRFSARLPFCALAPWHCWWCHPFYTFAFLHHCPFVHKSTRNFLNPPLRNDPTLMIVLSTCYNTATKVSSKVSGICVDKSTRIALKSQFKF